jgi:hypothetical protein
MDCYERRMMKACWAAWCAILAPAICLAGPTGITILEQQHHISGSVLGPEGLISYDLSAQTPVSKAVEGIPFSFSSAFAGDFRVVVSASPLETEAFAQAESTYRFTLSCPVLGLHVQGQGDCVERNESIARYRLTDLTSAVELAGERFGLPDSCPGLDDMRMWIRSAASLSIRTTSSSSLSSPLRDAEMVQEASLSPPMFSASRPLARSCSPAWAPGSSTDCTEAEGCDAGTVTD